MRGKTAEEAKAELEKEGKSGKQLELILPHKVQCDKTVYNHSQLAFLFVVFVCWGWGWEGGEGGSVAK